MLQLIRYRNKYLIHWNVSIYLLLIYRYSYFRLFSGRSESIRNKLELNVSGSISSQTSSSYLYMDHNYVCDYAMQMRDTSDERSPNEISIIWQHLDGLIWQRLRQFSRTSAVNLSACLCVCVCVCFGLKSAAKAIGNASTEHRAQDTARCIRIRRERYTNGCVAASACRGRSWLSCRCKSIIGTVWQLYLASFFHSLSLRRGPPARQRHRET